MKKILTNAVLVFLVLVIGAAGSFIFQQAQVAAKDEQISIVRADKQALEKQLAANNDLIEKMRVSQDTILSATLGKLDDAENEKSILLAKLETAMNGKATAEAGKASASTASTLLAKQLDDIKSEYEGWKKEFVYKIVDLQRQLDKSRAETNAASNQLVATVAEQLNQQNATTAAFQQQLAAKDAEIATARQTITGLQSQIGTFTSTATIVGRVWVDSTNPLSMKNALESRDSTMSGVKLDLRKQVTLPDGRTDWVTAATVTTSNNGQYIFSGLSPGAYYIYPVLNGTSWNDYRQYGYIDTVTQGGTPIQGPIFLLTNFEGGLG